MNYHSFSDDLPYMETVCTDSKKRIPAIRQQRRQISRMIGMVVRSGRIMSPCFRKALSGTAFALMDMQGKKPGPAVLRKSRKLRHHKNLSVLLIKPDSPG